MTCNLVTVIAETKGVTKSIVISYLNFKAIRQYLIRTFTFKSIFKVDWKKLFKNHQNLHNTFKWGLAKKRFVNINLENDPVSCVKVTGTVHILGQ